MIAICNHSHTLTTWVFQVSKYIVVIEGIPQMEKYLINQSFSCRRFFQSVSSERDLSTTIYVYFQYRNASCKKLPSYSCNDNASDLVIFESGTYDLLEVTHKFPMSQKVQSIIVSISMAFFILVIEGCKLLLCCFVTHKALKVCKPLEVIYFLFYHCLYNL